MPVEFKHQTLDHGLNIIAECNPAAHTSSVGFFVNTGTRDEELPVMGVSHFLEHMMFKGTDRRTADDVNREFDEIGANYNAYTNHERTVYYAQVLPEFFDRAVDLLGDMMRPTLREEDFNVEKKVILEEIGMYDDRPDWRLYDSLIEQYFANHPLGYRILGTTDSIEKLNAEQMREYFLQRYSPDNITVAATGRVDFDKLCDDMGTITANWQATGATRNYNPPAVQAKAHDIKDATVNRQYIAALCPGPSAQDETRYAAKILADVLGDADGSRLYWALVDPGLADEADFSFYPMDRVGCFMCYASCSPENAEAVEKTLLDTVEHSVEKLDADEVERAKNKVATLATLQEESPMGRMQVMGTQWQVHERYIPLAEELDKLMAVTLDDIRNLYAATAFDQRTIVRLGPEGNGR